MSVETKQFSVGDVLFIDWAYGARKVKIHAVYDELYVLHVPNQILYEYVIMSYSELLKKRPVIYTKRWWQFWK